MRPESQPKAHGKPSKEPFLELGIPEEWEESLQELGYDSVDKLKAEEKPDRLHQKMMEFRKNGMLEIGTLTVEDVSAWLEKD